MTTDADTPEPELSGVDPRDEDVDGALAVVAITTRPDRINASGDTIGPVAEVESHDELDADSEADTDFDIDESQHSRIRAFVDWVVVIAIALFVAFLIRGFVLAHFVVDGHSMESTLSSGDRVFVNKLSYRLHDPNRGDVVVLHQISGTSERDLIKRVVALPGESIQGDESCSVFIDGRMLTEPYLDPEVVVAGTCGSFGPVLIGDEQVFVMGDNRNGSQDSRSIGPVAYGDLVGRAFVVFWPRQNWQWL